MTLEDDDNNPSEYELRNRSFYGALEHARNAGPLPIEDVIKNAGLIYDYLLQDYLDVDEDGEPILDGLIEDVEYEGDTFNIFIEGTADIDLNELFKLVKDKLDN